MSNLIKIKNMSKSNLKLVFQREYRHKVSGNQVYVYGVTGPAKEVAEYVKSNPKVVFADDKKTPLFFSAKVYLGNTCGVIKTQKGEFRADMSEHKQAASMIGNLSGDDTLYYKELAKQMVAQKLGKASGAPIAVEEPSAEGIAKS